MAAKKANARVMQEAMGKVLSIVYRTKSTVETGIE
jgi:hypothetical protein